MERMHDGDVSRAWTQCVFRECKCTGGECVILVSRRFSMKVVL